MLDRAADVGTVDVQLMSQPVSPMPSMLTWLVAIAPSHAWQVWPLLGPRRTRGRPSSGSRPSRSFAVISCSSVFMRSSVNRHQSGSQVHRGLDARCVVSKAEVEARSAYSRFHSPARPWPRGAPWVKLSLRGVRSFAPSAMVKCRGPFCIRTHRAAARGAAHACFRRFGRCGRTASVVLRHTPGAFDPPDVRLDDSTEYRSPRDRSPSRAGWRSASRDRRTASTDNRRRRTFRCARA